MAEGWREDMDRRDLQAVALGRAPADLVVFELDRPWRIDPDALRSKSKNSPFDGHPVQGRVVTTVVGRRTVFERQAAA